MSRNQDSDIPLKSQAQFLSMNQINSYSKQVWDNILQQAIDVTSQYKIAYLRYSSVLI